VKALLRGAATGLGLGAAWGVLARVWMRLISNDPEFSWAGTLAILGMAAVLGAGVGVVHVARRSGRSAWWTLAVLPGLVLFMSPGMVLAPAFLLGGPAYGGRGRWLRAVGWLAILGPTVAMTFAVSNDPTSVAPTMGDYVVFEVGLLALALSLAWASSLVWQRRTPSKAPPAATEVAARALR
jgi:hypothetical protein